MKTKKLLLIAFLLAVFISALYDGCTNETTGPPAEVPGFKPTIRLKLYSTYQYTNDTILPSGLHQRKPGIITNDTIKTFSNFNGKNAFGIFSHTIGQPSVIYYVSYDSTAGLYYQWGITNLINPSQSPSWDVAANFAASRSSNWVIGQINDTLTFSIPSIGTITVPFSGPLTGKVADSTIVVTTSAVPDTIHCYRIEYNANISGTTVINLVTITFSASIYVEYYIGYYSPQFPNNPSGLVELRLNPFNITTSPTLITIQEGGYDRILQSYTIAP